MSDHKYTGVFCKYSIESVTEEINECLNWEVDEDTVGRIVTSIFIDVEATLGHGWLLMDTHFEYPDYFSIDEVLEELEYAFSEVDVQSIVTRFTLGY